MSVTLRLFFAVVLLSMLAVTGWAGWHVPLWEIPREVGGHPWFVATLADAYWGFFTFYAWVWYKEPTAVRRAAWFVALVLLGNIAMASYGLAVLAGLPRDARPEQILLRGAPVPLLLPFALSVGLLGVSAVAWLV